jgi:hypothetical protein
MRTPPYKQTDERGQHGHTDTDEHDTTPHTLHITYYTTTQTKTTTRQARPVKL